MKKIAISLLSALVISGCVEKQTFGNQDVEYCDSNEKTLNVKRGELRECVDQNIPPLAKSGASAYEVTDAVVFKCQDKINQFADTIHEASVCNVAQKNNESLYSVRSILPDDSVRYIRDKGVKNAKNTILTNVIEYRSSHGG